MFTQNCNFTLQLICITFSDVKNYEKKLFAFEVLDRKFQKLCFSFIILQL